MHESKFQLDLRKGFQGQGFYFEKISDVAQGIRKPFDLHGCILGRYIAIEAKLLTYSGDDWVRYGKAIVCHNDMQGGLEGHQIQELRKVKLAGGKAFVAAGLYSRTNFRSRRAWLIDIDDFIQFNLWHLNDLEEKSIQLFWRPNFGWNLTEGESKQIAFPEIKTNA